MLVTNIMIMQTFAQNIDDLVSRANLELIIKKSPAAVAVFDVEMKYLCVSDRWIKDYKLENIIIIGRSHYDVFPEILEMPRWLDLHKRALNGEIIKCDEDQWDRNQHASEILQYEIHPWHKNDGSIGGIIMFTQVITSNKNIERELKKQNTIFQKIMEESPIGVALLHTDGRWMEVNDALCDFLEYDKEDLLLTNFQNITYADDLDIDLRHVADLLAGNNSSYFLEKRYITKTGKLVWGLLSATLIRDDQNNPAFFLSQIVDITALKESDEMKENFISLVSHELKTPLASIILSLDLLGQYKSVLRKKAFDKYLGVANRGCYRLSSLLSDITDAEKIQTKSFLYTPQNVSVNQILEQSIIENSIFAQAHNVVVDKKYDLDVHIYVDPDRLVQVITNFLSNAIKFSPQDKPILLGSKISDNTIIIFVKDCGFGISKEFQTNIFGKFMRDDNDTNRKKGGTGLGLYISREIVKAMNGEIGFESQVNIGSTFWCSFPVVLYS